MATLTSQQRIEQFCSRCVNWIDEEEAELTDDIPHCSVDGLGLTTMRLEETGKCDRFFER
jgi:hypothetical protein